MEIPYTPTREDHNTSVKAAEDQGLEVIKGSGIKLLLDLDTEQDLKDYEVTLALLQDYYGLVETNRWTSKGGNTHVTLDCEWLSREDRVMLQAVLGSDRKRAAINLILCREDGDEVSFLFKPPKVKTQAAPCEIITDEDVPF